MVPGGSGERESVFFKKNGLKSGGFFGFGGVLGKCFAWGLG